MAGEKTCHQNAKVRRGTDQEHQFAIFHRKVTEKTLLRTNQDCSSFFKMKSLVFLIFASLRILQASANPGGTHFHRLVCQQCDTWCVAEGSSLPIPTVRVGKTGPRGPPGPRGSVNMTAIEEMVDRKIEKAIGHLSVRNCQEVSMQSVKQRGETGGVFDIYIPGLRRTEVYCDVRTDGGGWIVFQRRMDGSVDFYRDWSNYVNGFGSLTGEFWLGLEAIYKLTSAGPCELRIDMVDRNNERYYAAFSNFGIGSASDKYRLKVTGYSGNATDAFGDPPGSGGDHNNQKFSTKDQDNDNGSRNCARERQGGWWYNQCTASNLNGLYDDLNSWNGVVWYNQGLKSKMFLKFTEMKFRFK